MSEAQKTVSEGASSVRRRALGPLLLGALLCALPYPAQPTQAAAGTFAAQISAAPVVEIDPIMEEKRLKAMNALRQKSMLADADKLLKLATELNAEVNGTQAGNLTEEQLRKVAQIEKLARSVREKMCTSVASPELSPAPLAIPLPPGP